VPAVQEKHRANRFPACHRRLPGFAPVGRVGDGNLGCQAAAYERNRGTGEAPSPPGKKTTPVTRWLDRKGAGQRSQVCPPSCVCQTWPLSPQIQPSRAEMNEQRRMVPTSLVKGSASHFSPASVVFQTAAPLPCSKPTAYPTLSVGKHRSNALRPPPPQVHRLPGFAPVLTDVGEAAVFGEDPPLRPIKHKGADVIELASQHFLPCLAPIGGPKQLRLIHASGMKLAISPDILRRHHPHRVPSMSFLSGLSVARLRDGEGFPREAAIPRPPHPGPSTADPCCAS